MTSGLFLTCLALLLAASLVVESGMLSGLFSFSVTGYHLIHLLLMTGLLAITGALWWRRRRESAPDAPVVALFALGLVFTLIGDYVNSRLSDVNPVTLKLTWALLFFGLGYSCYIAGLWRGLALVAPGARRLWPVIPVILALNVTGWLTSVAARVAGQPVLSYGSFVFNATLYVILPWLAIRYLVACRYGLASVVVMIGAVLLPFSDLVLFKTWLPRPDDEPVSLILYSSNWILYFGGQCLMNVFTAALAMTPPGNRSAVTSASG